MNLTPFLLYRWRWFISFWSRWFSNLDSSTARRQSTKTSLVSIFCMRTNPSTDVVCCIDSFAHKFHKCLQRAGFAVFANCERIAFDIIIIVSPNTNIFAKPIRMEMAWCLCRRSSIQLSFRFRFATFFFSLLCSIQPMVWRWKMIKCLLLRCHEKRDVATN